MYLVAVMVGVVLDLVAKLLEFVPPGAGSAWPPGRPDRGSVGRSRRR